ncbi:hypothetical protein AAVH_06028 [Aphelenchoides avenae]|nr:hypothetical protein AAVH_06028 [Aphelenchus avenae]
MNAFGISLGFLLALTLVYALEKDIPSAANDAQPVNAAHAQEDGIKDAVNATWPFRAFVRRHPLKSANERRNDGHAKDGVRGEKIHRRSRRDDDFEERRKKAKTVVLFILIAPFLLMCLGLGVGVGRARACKVDELYNPLGRPHILRSQWLAQTLNRLHILRSQWLFQTLSRPPILRSQ